MVEPIQKNLRDLPMGPVCNHLQKSADLCHAPRSEGSKVAVISLHNGIHFCQALDIGYRRGQIRGGWTCVINRHYMSRDHGKNKAKLNFEAQSLHQFAPDCTIQFWENILTKEAFEGSPALLTTT